MKLYSIKGDFRCVCLRVIRLRSLCKAIQLEDVLLTKALQASYLHLNRLTDVQHFLLNLRHSAEHV
jgi:hypothetical protein